MHHDRISLGDLIEHIARPAAGIHVVFRNDLEPIDIRLMLENMRKMNGAQPNPQPEIRMA